MTTVSTFGRLVSHYLQCYIINRTKIGITADLLSELCKLQVNRVTTLKCWEKKNLNPEFYNQRKQRENKAFPKQKHKIITR